MIEVISSRIRGCIFLGGEIMGQEDLAWKLNTFMVILLFF
jgi:hypothetical protein